MNSGAGGDAPAGLQAERTSLAWSRTALTAAALGAAALKAGVSHDDGTTLSCAGFAFLAAVALYLCGRVRSRGGTAGRSQAVARLLLIAVGSSVLAGVFAIATVIAKF